MSHSFISLADFKSEGAANVSGDSGDLRIMALLEAVSLEVEGICRRGLHPVIATRYFSGNGKSTLNLLSWDIIAVTTLKEDSDRDGTYEVTWAVTDYLLGPYENDPTDHVDPKPYWRLEVDGRSSGSQDAFLMGQRMYELVGKFGYCELTKDTLATINEGSPFGISDTILTVSDKSNIGAGDTLVIESEYLYVTGLDNPDTNNFTVIRAANGSTAAAHADGIAISKLTYPEPIRQGVMMQTERLWKRREGGYTEDIDYLNAGGITPKIGIDLDVRQMLDPYKRVMVT